MTAEGTCREKYKSYSDLGSDVKYNMQRVDLQMLNQDRTVDKG